MAVATKAQKAHWKPPHSLMPLEALAEMAPIPATEDMPAEIQAMLKRQTGLFIRSESRPQMGFATEKVPGAPGIWHVLGSPHDEELRSNIPGEEQIDLSHEDPRAAANETISSTPDYRPPWASLEFLPRLVPFQAGDQVMFEPRVHEETNRLSYPWRTIGLVKSSSGWAGTGVLVGPNLLLTAAHLAPWEGNPWHIEFIPGFKAGERPPFGTSFVQRFRGYRPTSVTGTDYVVCKLFTPLGRALGWYESTDSGPGIIASIIGALIILGIYRMIIGRRRVAV